MGIQRSLANSSRMDCLMPIRRGGIRCEVILGGVLWCFIVLVLVLENNRQEISNRDHGAATLADAMYVQGFKSK